MALKIMQEDSSELDEEDMVMITRKFKNFFKKTKERNKEETPQQVQEHRPRTVYWVFQV